MYTNIRNLFFIFHTHRVPKRSPQILAVTLSSLLQTVNSCFTR